MFLWKSKFCSGSGSWYYFGFQYQTYISYIEDPHQILFGSANSFESYCVHMKSPRTYSQTTRQTDRETDGNCLCLFCLLRHTIQNINIRQTERIFFFHSCDYNTFSFYILRMWWESKNIKKYTLAGILLYIIKFTTTYSYESHHYGGCNESMKCRASTLPVSRKVKPVIQNYKRPIKSVKNVDSRFTN